MKTTNRLLHYVQDFFQDYLNNHRGLSSNTILAYRDALKLFLSFVAGREKKPATRLVMEDLRPDAVLAFLKEIEKVRKNSIVTRNLRLAALKTFFTYMVTQDTMRVGQYQQILAIPLKQASKPLIGYLEVQEVKAILNMIDRISRYGERDYVLLNLLYNTGARVQEVCDLSVSAVRLNHPAFVTITGKGRKTRQVPLWPETASLLKSYLANQSVLDKPEAKLFLNARGEAIGRFGIRHIIRKRIADASSKCPSLITKKIGPHTFRHTTAMHLLQAGVDLTLIKSWLGHVDLSTTHGYLEIDLEMKRKALSACSPVGKPNALRELMKQNKDVINWLDSISH
jgi:site-specific recombinase XerD